MADSANILSILATLAQPSQQGITPITYRPVPAPGDEPVSNVLQAAMAPPQSPTAPAPRTPAAPTVQKPAEHPRKRLSVIDTIGRLADVVARVGGADALYQPTLDARQDRASQIDLDALKKRLTVAQVGEAELEPVLAERKRLGTALGALANNPNAAELWPSIAEQAGIDAQHSQAIGQILQGNPNAAGIFAKALGADIDNLGKNVFFGTGPDGKTVAYQVGPDGNPHILDFSASGVTPSDPIKIVNTGGSNVVIGSGGGVKRILPNTARPDTIINARTSEGNNIRTNQTNLTIAGMPARGKGGAGATGDNSAFIQTAQGNLDELRAIYADLKKKGAMVSPGQSSGANISARLRASGLGQTLEGAVGTAAQTQRDRIASIRPGLMQAIAKATGMTGKQLDSNADVKLFMATVTDPSKSYEANIAAINGLERFLRANAKKAAAPAAHPTKVLPAGNSGWGKAKVVGG
jgi:hypothetical protein